MAEEAIRPIVTDNGNYTDDILMKVRRWDGVFELKGTCKQACD